MDYRTIEKEELNRELFRAFERSCLKGFASVEAGLLGAKKEYLDLTTLHVSRDQRGKGTGSRLQGGRGISAGTCGAGAL